MNALYDHDSRQAENDVASSRFEPGVSAPSRIMVRAKLEMTTPGDSDEQEAEAMADAVVREGKIARSVSAGHSGGGVAMPSQMGGRLSALQGHGSRLYGELKDHMETGFGRDFSDVSLHTDDAAAEMSSSIGARAFTYGSDIYFGRGQFSPDTTAGQHLLAHELAHVSQGTGKVARDPLPKNAQEIKEMTKTEDEEGQLRKSLCSVLDEFVATDEIISKNDSVASLKTLETVLKDCEELIVLANNLHTTKTSVGQLINRLGLRGIMDQLVYQIVQQVYNTLSEVSVAMDILEKPVNSNKSKLSGTRWMKCRKKFIIAVQNLAKLAHNPAIAVLMYEGTFYPHMFDGITGTATQKATGEKKDPTDLSYFGAVCNNAAYGSIVSSEVEYLMSDSYKPDTNSQNDAEERKKRLFGLGKDGRLKWSSYAMQGKGFGNDALAEAKQGDAVVFWSFYKLDDEVLFKMNVLNEKQLSILSAIKNEEKHQKKKEEIIDSIIDDLQNQESKIDVNLIFNSDLDAHHIEILVGVNKKNGKYLLSGAHGYKSKEPNGIQRYDKSHKDKENVGKLAWKDADGIRNKRIMRLFPVNNDSDMIPVNIPSIMEKQLYTPKEDENWQWSHTHKTTGITVSGPIVRFQNKKESVKIIWLKKK